MGRLGALLALEFAKAVSYTGPVEAQRAAAGRRVGRATTRPPIRQSVKKKPYGSTRSR